MKGFTINSQSTTVSGEAQSLVSNANRLRRGHPDPAEPVPGAVGSAAAARPRKELPLAILATRAPVADPTAVT